MQKPMNADVGELIYVPSEVVLFKGESKQISDWTKTKAPVNLLVTNVNNSTYEVFYNNEYWLVERSSTYKL